MKSSNYGPSDPRSWSLLRSAAGLPLHEKVVRWPRRDRTILMGQKAKSTLSALSAARGQYPVYCQHIGRRIHREVLCTNENMLASSILRLDWRVDHVVIRKVF